MSPRILVIDSDNDTHLFLKLTLQPYGHQIIDATDAGQGLNLARGENPDLVILEPAIGGGAGFDLCRRLRMLPGSRPCPILILSQMRGREEVVRGLEAGASDYLVKPANAVELAARVHALLGYRQALTPTVILVAGAKGGVGATTIAVNLGVALASLEQDRVALIDTEIPGGDPAVHLGVTPQHTLLDLISYGAHVDAELVEAVACRHRSGLRLLAAPVEEVDQPIPPDYLAPIVQAMTGRQSYVILDYSLSGAESFASLAHLADHILVVSTPELPALIKADAALAAAQHDIEHKGRLRLIVNQADREGGTPVGDLPSQLKMYPITQLPYDPAKILPSINAGEPLALRLPNQPWAREIMRLARSLRDPEEATDTEPKASERVRTLLLRMRSLGTRA